MREIVLHIGTEKTATTSLQSFFALNQRKLSDAGIWYPYEEALDYCHRSAHFPLAASLCEECPDFVTRDKYFDSKTLFARLFEDFAQQPEHTLLLSAEHFSSRCSRPERIGGLGELLRERNLRILVYLRPQHEMLLSAYSTFLRSGGKKTLDEVSRSMWLRPKALYFNYLFMLQRWWETFGRERVSVRIFQPGRLVGGDIYQDFLACLGVDLPAPITPEKQNEQMSKELADFLYLANQHFPTFRENDRRGWELGQRFRGEISPLFARSGSPMIHLLSEELRRDTKEFFAEYNRELCDIARPELGGQLFLEEDAPAAPAESSPTGSANCFSEEFVSWIISQWKAARPLRQELEAVLS